MMKSMNSWTRLLALLTLTLGTLAEGSALAALPQASSTPHNSPDSSRREIAQIPSLPQALQNQCALLEQPTEMTITTEDGNRSRAQLAPQTYVKLLSRPQDAPLTQVHSYEPPLIGLIPSVNLGQVHSCIPTLVFQDPPTAEESYECYEVNVTGTWPVYSAPTTVVRPTSRPLRDRDLVLYLGDREIGDQFWINIRPVSRSRNTPLESGWIIADDESISLDPVRAGVCD
jgi:hypothetical protein